ncbi:MAG: hypothetical protein ABTD50_05315 [Polyangiaceae bacterium]|jgi:hypothetical protein
MSRTRKSGLSRATALVGLAMIATGCLTRPVVSDQPTLKTNFTDTLNNTSVNKIDLLFDIDNSASMGDKQDFLNLAVPDLLSRLLNPNCVDPANPNNVLAVSQNGICTQGALEFPPIHDMHIGIVTSSLGPRLADQDRNPRDGLIVCEPSVMAPVPFQNVSAHNDDQGHLIDRSLTLAGTTATEGTVADAVSGYLDWYPQVAGNGAVATTATPVSSTAQLESDFQSLVSGVGVFGCGIESQLESWYRFLIQPDPYASLSLDSNGRAQWDGVDTTILQQRQAFLRPDSLVAVVVLTDENDSEIDVRSYDGTGYLFMQSGFNPWNGTTACAANPGSDDCTSCGLTGATGTATDPNCTPPNNQYTQYNDWGYNLNLRHVHMKQKYGLDPQYPIQRYVNGLTSPEVPDRNGEYPNGAGSYQGQNDCTNPLFAASLPNGSDTDAGTLCNLTPGTRPATNVFYAHIGGVPYQLLHFTPNDPQASLLTGADWVNILGNDPSNYDYTGIDPHMVESYQPRPGIAPADAGNDADPIVGRDWVTNQGEQHVLDVDREYACTFQLAAPRDCTLAQNSDNCDCPAEAGLTPEELPPICDPVTQTTQVGAKAYPTVRELLLAKLMGNQGIVSSLCPPHPVEQGASDPLYGYRPAVAVIIDRLKSALQISCPPHQLVTDADGGVPGCLVLATFNDGTTSCSAAGAGYEDADPTVLADFRQGQHNDWVAAGSVGTDPSTELTCKLDEIYPLNGDPTNSCTGVTSQQGWCYVVNNAIADSGSGCSYQILFADNGPQKNTTLNLTCVETLNTASAPGAP